MKPHQDSTETYLGILSRNGEEVYQRMKKISENEAKFEAVLKKYKLATDRNNPLRDKINISPEMNGYMACDL